MDRSLCRNDVKKLVIPWLHIFAGCNLMAENLVCLVGGSVKKEDMICQ